MDSLELFKPAGKVCPIGVTSETIYKVTRTNVIVARDVISIGCISASPIFIKEESVLGRKSSFCNSLFFCPFVNPGAPGRQ